ncbi:hypothetical protein BD289DRAFT_453188 [Coniella lustricola]|uniref:CFEM domain-containing protein n=1 Tax=Coniella lustricola TaxID=2025994 RepID=A0A2T3A8F9_9PEZI|nr:hypothetical protein BD289DRAFT_453188 [Coniella lustricola]
MKLPSVPLFAILTTALYSSNLALAQNCVATALSVIPSCAQNCILNGATSIGCGGTDFGCQCQQTAALFAAVDGCLGGCKWDSDGVGDSRTVVSATSSIAATSASSAASSSLQTSVTSSGSQETWTGYSSVGTVATAYVVGAAARPTPPPALEVFKYVVPIVVAGAVIL